MYNVNIPEIWVYKALNVTLSLTISDSVSYSVYASFPVSPSDSASGFIAGRLFQTVLRTQFLTSASCASDSETLPESVF